MKFNKALTFSYDDSVRQDERLAELFHKYGLKATFNVNSQRLGAVGTYTEPGVDKVVDRSRILPEDVARIYKGHEVAGHTLTHPILLNCTDEEVIRQVEEDRKALSQMVGYEVVGFVYPGGAPNHDERVERLIREHTGVKYIRAIEDSNGFDISEDLYRFRPSVFHGYTDRMFELGKQLLEMKPDKPQLLYVWGHSYELDLFDMWDELEEFCKMMSGRDDIFYGTNREVLLGSWEK